MQSHESLVHPVQISDEVMEQLHAQAEEFLDALASNPLNSPDFRENLDTLNKLGQGLNKDTRWILSPSKTHNEDDPQKTQAQVSEALQSLNGLVKTLTPKASFSIGSLFGGEKRVDYEKYFERYDRAQDDISEVVNGLLTSRDYLLRENGRLIEESNRLYEVLNKVYQYRVFADVISDKLKEQVVELKKQNPHLAEQYATEVGFVIHRKQQDFITLQNVIAQAYMALSITRRNNEETRKNLETAQMVTITALETAQQVGYALTRQQRFLDEIDGLTQEARDTVHHIKKELPRTASPEDESRAMARLADAFGKARTVIQEFELKQVEQVEQGQK